MNIDSIQERPGNSCPVALNLRDGTGALVAGIGQIAAGTGIHRRRQHKIGRVGNGQCRPGNGDLSVFQRLPHHFQHIFLEFRQFIQKQNAVVRQAHFTRMGNLSAADQPGIADGVMGRAERPGGDKSFIRCQSAGNRVNFCGFQCLFKRHIR
ncbi:hypothetical protein BMS3Bbin03_02946 [bacterium BMS3Bbin03]|nr:hypothetical protein BMS3Bbin03_02946 [bacterium BMS3Bbin03]